MDYALFLQEEGKQKGNKAGIRNKLSNLRSTLNRAKKKEILTYDEEVFNPVFHFLQESQHTPKTVHSSIIKKIAKIKMDSYSDKERLRCDLFLFSYYAGGMVPVDVIFLTYSLIKDVITKYQHTKCSKKIAKPFLPLFVLEFIELGKIL